jgi:hypothetical protein
MTLKIKMCKNGVQNLWKKNHNYNYNWSILEEFLILVPTINWIVKMLAPATQLDASLHNCFKTYRNDLFKNSYF